MPEEIEVDHTSFVYPIRLPDGTCAMRVRNKDGTFVDIPVARQWMFDHGMRCLNVFDSTTL